MRVSSSAAKLVVESYLSAISARDFDALPGYFNPSSSWWISGNPARVPKAGTKLALDQVSILPGLLTRFEEYSYNINTIVAEGPNVLVDAQAIGTGPLDLVYINNITSAYVIGQDGKIESLRENPVHSEIDWLLEWFAQHPNATNEA